MSGWKRLCLCSTRQVFWHKLLPILSNITVIPDLIKFSAGRPLVGKNCEWEASVKCRADRSIFVSIPEAAVQQYANGMQNALVQGSLIYLSHINWKRYSYSQPLGAVPSTFGRFYRYYEKWKRLRDTFFLSYLSNFTRFSLKRIARPYLFTYVSLKGFFLCTFSYFHPIFTFFLVFVWLING